MESARLHDLVLARLVSVLGGDYHDYVGQWRRRPHFCSAINTGTASDMIMSMSSSPAVFGEKARTPCPRSDP